MSQLRTPDFIDTLAKPQDLPGPFEQGPPGGGYGAGGLVNDIGSNASADQLSANYYDQYLVDTRIDMHSGWVQVPVGGADGTPCELCKVRASWQTKTVQFTAQRQNDWPVVPAPSTGDPNDSFLDGFVQFSNPLDGPQQQKVYRVSGRYVFAMSRPVLPGGQVMVANVPVNTDGPVLFTPAYFSPLILDDGGGGMLHT